MTSTKLILHTMTLIILHQFCKRRNGRDEQKVIFLWLKLIISLKLFFIRKEGTFAWNNKYTHIK